MEIKGDWKQLHFCFAVPGWMSSGEKPICWRCTATKNSLVTESGLTSSFLQEECRLSHWQALQRIIEEGGKLSPVWGIPWMSMHALRIDWLHVADQGITPVFLGGLFHVVLCDRRLGANEEERCAWLWASIQEYYRAENVADRLHYLVKTMIKPKKGSIEMAGSGAQIRSLVTFALRTVNGWEPADLDAELIGARACMRHLAKCYSFLSAAAHEGEETFLQHALAFHHNLQGLHSKNPGRWQMRPKLHLLLELAAEGGPPSSSWNYREESFGGSVSRQSHHKGGMGTPLAMSRSALTKFCAKEALPRLR